MYSEILIDFFKRHNLYDEEMFKYLQEHTDIIDYRDEDTRVCIGCGYLINNKNNKLERFRICIPKVVDNKTALISIHEIVHGIVGYKNLNKKFKNDIIIEALAFLYEKLFINESNDPSLVKYGLYLDSLIEDNDEEKYKYALFARDYLLMNYEKDYYKMEKLSKKLTKKYNKSIKN